MNLKSLTSDFRKYRNLFIIIFIFCMMTTLSFLAMRGMRNSSATASTANFNPGNIISDAVMANYNSMSRSDIQNFLTARGNCNNTNYNQYLQLKAAYPSTDWHFENGHFICLADERFGDGVAYGSALNPGEGQSAADIIYEAAQDYRINPQVLLVLLEKEQSLITDNYPNSNQFRSATGYGCPDTAACSSKYYGFKNQVRNAAAMFRGVLDGGWSNYPVGQLSYIQYNPSANCGGSMVYIENRATSSLYRYTPYQPNSAALAAGYGTGDTCSAYGNRNFYLLFTDWFGNTQVAINKTPLVLPDGEYIFISQSGSVKKSLGVASTNTDDTNVQLVDFNQNDTRTKWSLKKTADGYYTIIHSATNKALDLNVGNYNITLWTLHGGLNQKWRLYAADNGGLLFESASMPGLVISIDNITNVNAQLYHQSVNQQWQLFVGQTLNDGAYTISSANSNAAVLDANGFNDGDNVSIWSRHGGSNQEWIIAYDAVADAYSLINSATGKQLDLQGASTNSGTNVQLWQNNSSCAQKWKFLKTNDNFVLLSSCSLEYAVDLHFGSTLDGNNVQVWPVHGEPSQQWHFAAGDQSLISGQTYTIIPKNSLTSVLDTASDHNVSIWTRHSGNNQRWKLIYNQDTKDYTFLNLATNAVLDAAGGYSLPGINIQVWPNLNICTQRWSLDSAGDGSYIIASTCDSNIVLDLYTGATFDGNNIQLWQRHGGVSQRFIIAH